MRPVSSDKSVELLPDFPYTLWRCIQVCIIQPSSKKLYDTSVVIVVCAPSGVSTQVRLSGIGANAEIGGETYISRVKIGCMEATYAVIGVWHKRLYAGSIFHNSIQLFCA